VLSYPVLLNRNARSWNNATAVVHLPQSYPPPHVDNYANNDGNWVDKQSDNDEAIYEHLFMEYIQFTTPSQRVLLVLNTHPLSLNLFSHVLMVVPVLIAYGYTTLHDISPLLLRLTSSVHILERHPCFPVPVMPSFTQRLLHLIYLVMFRVML